MAAVQETQEISFAGTKAKQQQAERIFNLFRARGMFMSDNAPIRIELDKLTAFVQEQDGKKPADTIAILEANPEVFAIETIETRTYSPAPVVEAVETEDTGEGAEEVEAEVAPPIETVTNVTWVTTTRIGKVPTGVTPVNTHTFAQRLMTPEPKIERPAEPVRERPRVDPSWATFTIPEGLLDIDEDFAEEEPVAATQSEPVAAEVAAPETIEEPAAVVEEPVAAVAEPRRRDTNRRGSIDVRTSGRSFPGSGISWDRRSVRFQ
jgi:hypothetical protein